MTYATMFSNRAISPPSDDADTLVADLLQEFSSTTGLGTEKTAHLSTSKALSRINSLDSQNDALDNLMRSFLPKAQKDREARVAAVEIPPVQNTLKFKWIQGHSTVRRVLDQKRSNDEIRYLVELESSDKEWLTPSLITNLTHGQRYLLDFENSNSSSRYNTSRRKRRRSDMDPPSRRQGRKPVNRGFVSSAGLQFSDEDRETTDEPSLSSSDARRSPAPKKQRLSLRLTRRNDKDSSDSSESLNSSDAGPRRRLRTRPQSRITSVLLSASDEDSSSEDIITRSNRTNRRKTRRSTRQVANRRTSRRLREVQFDSDSDDRPAQGVRFSTRHRNSRRSNLAERKESDISENEGKASGTKYSGAKEHFARLSKDDEFRIRHRNVCDTCFGVNDNYNDRGPLVFCQGCTSAYHKVCLGPRSTREHLVTKVGHHKFILQCRRCLGIPSKKDPTAPHQGHCTTCQLPGALSEPLRERLTPRQEQQLRDSNDGFDPITKVDGSLIDNTSNVMFRCTSCTRAFHFEHLPPRSDAVPDSDNLTVGEIANIRFKEYTRRWLCLDCIDAPGEIETMVSWRPVDPDSYTPGFTADVLDEIEKEYLIKWKRKSYFRTTWMPGAWVWGVASGAMRKAFFRSTKGIKPHLTAEDAIPEEYLRVDIVLDVRYTNIVSNRTKEIDLARVKEVKEAFVKYKGLLYEDAVWETTPTPEDGERWNDFKVAYEDWVLHDYVHVPKQGILKKNLAAARAQDFKLNLVKKVQPSNLTGGKIMDYQLDGLNWLYYMWYSEKNAILADEMGLGKTIQVIAFLATMIQDHRCYPWLVVVPNATCPNWRREMKKWAPSLRAVTYYGSSVARRIAHDYEMFPNGASDLRCHVLITSYETISDEKNRRVFSKIPWAGLVVDEGQRLKNEKNQLYESLSRIAFPFKLLLTGTPLQNNTRELFNLIQFCDPTKNASVLEEKYQTLTRENVPELHEMLRPFFLRRTKAQVLTFLPPMAQIIIPVSMSIVQKKLYKSILAKNSQLIKSIFKTDSNHKLKQTERHNLSNILMQLRKCLCHPFVYSKAIEERSLDSTVSHQNLVQASGKLQLLELMLPKLKERGHRVLIFSQFLDNLDIVEDFLDGLGFLHCRLDGSMSAHEKQKRIDEYNAPNSPVFAFLLSTRAGGVGINLATADTVLIMDPDFNPHQDIQALSRAHRIGQEKKVLVFQLMTKASAEEKIMQIGRKKMALDHLIIERMDAEDDEPVDLESILRYGAEALFDNDDSKDIHYDSASVDKLIDRSQAENTETGNDASAESQFSFARVWANDVAGLEDRLNDSDTAAPLPNKTLWEQILKERETAAAEEAARQAQSLGRGKRRRKVVDYNINDGAGPDQSPDKKLGNAARGADSDAEFTANGEASDNDYSEEEDLGPEERTPVQKTIKARTFKRVEPDNIRLPALDGTSDLPLPVSTRRSPCLACNKLHPIGYCYLKLAGVEHCGLCGIAHIGFQRACPHLHNEVQVQLMLDALKQSTEPRELIEQARQYLRGIKGDLAQRRRRIEEKSTTNFSVNGHLPVTSDNAAHPGPGLQTAHLIEQSRIAALHAFTAHRPPTFSDPSRPGPPHNPVPSSTSSSSNGYHVPSSHPSIPPPSYGRPEYPAYPVVPNGYHPAQWNQSSDQPRPS